MALSRITNPFLSSSGAGNASITSPSANTIAFSTTTTERMRIDSSGNLGIGITPSKKLDVNGAARFMQDAAATTGAIVLRQNSGDTVGGYIQWVSNSNAAEKGWMAVDTSSNMIFGVPSAERMRIDSSGRLLHNTTNGSATFHGFNSTSYGQRISGGIADSDIYQKQVVYINNIFTWTTVLSITPSTAGNTWMRGFVTATISGHNSGNYNASLINAIWYLDLNGGAGATSAQVSAGTGSGGGTPGFRVNMSGNVWQLQVQAPNTAQRFDGAAMFDIVISHGAGTTATYAIS